MSRSDEYLKKGREQLQGLAGRVNWKVVLVLGIILGAASLLYHTWRFMTLANL